MTDFNWFFTQKIKANITEYYIKKYIGILTPNVVVYTISMFFNYDNLMPCNVYDNRFSEIITAVNVLPNQYQICFINEYRHLTILSNSIFHLMFGNDKGKENRFFVDKRKPLIISEGISNEHYFVYTINNELYMYGEDMRYTGNVIDSNNPVLIDFNFDSNITQIDCNSSMTLFLTEKGNLYGSGIKNDTNIRCFKNGRNITQIGSLSTKCVYYSNSILKCFYLDILALEMVIVNGWINIRKFKCGDRHLCILSKDNIVYCHGSNLDGQCGISKNTVYLTSPMQCNLNTNDTIIDIKCASNHTIIKTINNNYYAFGANHSKQLFIDNNANKIYKPKLISHEYVKQKTGNMGTIIDIIPGYQQSFVLQMKSQ